MNESRISSWLVYTDLDSGLSASKSTTCLLFHNATHFIMERKRQGLEERKKILQAPKWQAWYLKVRMVSVVLVVAQEMWIG